MKKDKVRMKNNIIIFSYEANSEKGLLYNCLTPDEKNMFQRSF